MKPQTVEQRYAPGTALRQRLEARARELDPLQRALTSIADMLEVIHAHYTAP